MRTAREKTGWKAVCVLLAAGSMLLAAGPGGAQERDRDRDRLQDQDLDRVRSNEQFRQELGITEEQWGSVGPEVGKYLRGGGSGSEVRQMVREAQSAGCRGECLAESLRLMNRAREEGLSGPRAQQMVAAEVRAQVRERQERAEGGEKPDDRLLGQRLRERVENTLRHRSRTMEQRRPEPAAPGPTGSGPGSGMGGSRGGSGGHGGSGGQGGGGRGR